MIKSIFDIQPKLDELRKKGVIRGEDTGFRCLNELYSVKQGTFTFIYSEPTHGKSELTFEICMNQAERYGKRSLICSPETGSIEEIVAELIHKKTGRRIYESEYVKLEDVDYYNAIAWLNDWFIIVDSDDKAYSVPELFEMAANWEKENKRKIHIIVGEPYNELDHSAMANFGARQDLYIEDLCSTIRRACRKNKQHFILTIHPSGSATPISKNGFIYYPKPLPRQAAGGQALYRKAMTWITLWRPPNGYKNEYGQPCRDNEVHIHIEKAKPKGVAFKGNCKLYFDWKRNRYYEEAWGNQYYAFEQPEMIPVEPSAQLVIEQETPTQHHNLMLEAKQSAINFTPDPYQGEDPF